MEITSTNMSEIVTKTFEKCMFQEGEDTSNHVPVQGIARIFGLHPKRLEEQRETVKMLIAELHENFKQGWSFLKICENKEGHQWTDLHSVCEELVVMAVALGLAEYSFPRQLWPVLPGGVPYITIK